MDRTSLFDWAVGTVLGILVAIAVLFASDAAIHFIRWDGYSLPSWGAIRVAVVCGIVLNICVMMSD